MPRSNNQSAKVRAFLTAFPNANYAMYANRTKPGERVSASYFYNLKSVFKKSQVSEVAAPAIVAKPVEEAPTTVPAVTVEAVLDSVLVARDFLDRFATADQARAALSVAISLRQSTR